MAALPSSATIILRPLTKPLYLSGLTCEEKINKMLHMLSDIEKSDG